MKVIIECALERGREGEREKRERKENIPIGPLLLVFDDTIVQSLK